MNWKTALEKLTNWELWPFGLRYLPLAPLWAWYCLRSGSLWFFTASNPTITFGGFDGEGKKEIYDQLPPELLPKTIFIQKRSSFDVLVQKINDSGFCYPFCVKPDVGMKGLLFRIVHCEEQLRPYHSMAAVDYLVQELVEHPLEISIFYYRHPAVDKGVISGFIQKEPMHVVGDGRQTLQQLILQHPTARHRWAEMESRHKEKWNFVPAPGERYYLSYAANLNRGARFKNLMHLADENLHRFFDSLSQRTRFYYGRYDIKCLSVEDLKQGRFYILEFNGSGAEPNHVYHAKLPWLKALAVIAHHWKVLYQISAFNNRHGHPYWPFLKGWRFWRQSQKHLKWLEKTDMLIAA